MRLVVNVLLLFCSGISIQAQFYADSSATWCLTDIPGMNTLHIQFEMTPDPDTVIFGQTYKRIIEYNDEFGPWQEVERYYVRSTPDGKGYVFLLDSMAEFLTGDVTAVQGDTVEVLIKDQFWWGFGMQSTIVDSVVTLSNGGVTVTRHYLHTASSQGFLLPTDMFWQSGLGATQGPYLRLPTSLSEHLHCAFVAPNHVFFSSSIPMGSPGISCGCEPFPVSVAEVGTDQRTPIGLFPNPSTNKFMLSIETVLLSVAVFNPQGHEVLRTRERIIDLSGYAPGLYTAVVTTGRGRQAVRLVLRRE